MTLQVTLSYLKMIPQNQSRFWTWTPSKMAAPISEPRTATESEAFSLSVCLDSNKRVLLFFFTVIVLRQYTRIFGQKHFPRMQNVHFWLTGVAQKHLCLSSLINNQPLKRSLSQASLISLDLELPDMYNIKELRQQNGNGSKNVPQKVNLCCLKCHRSYANLINLSNVGDFFKSWILEDCMYLISQKENRCLVPMSSIKCEIRKLQV